MSEIPVSKLNIRNSNKDKFAINAFNNVIAILIKTPFFRPS